MAQQFDVCRVVGVSGQGGVELAVVLQDDSLSDLSTRVVAPLIALGARYEINPATPVVELLGVRYLVAVHLLATLSRRNLSDPVADLRREERTLKNALDAVFFGV